MKADCKIEIVDVAKRFPTDPPDMAPVLDAHDKIVLDLTRLRFIDSAGLGAFLSCLRKLTEKQGDLKLCAVSKQVRTAFALVRMHRILDIYDTREEATRALNT